MSEVMEEKVKYALETIRPYLKADGGDVELVRIADLDPFRFSVRGGCRQIGIASIACHIGSIRKDEAVRIDLREFPANSVHGLNESRRGKEDL